MSTKEWDAEIVAAEVRVARELAFAPGGPVARLAEAAEWAEGQIARYLDISTANGGPPQPKHASLRAALAAVRPLLSENECPDCGGTGITADVRWAMDRGTLAKICAPSCPACGAKASEW